MKPSERLGLVLIFFTIIIASLSFYENKQLENPSGGKERLSPSDFITIEDIEIYPDKIIVRVKGASLSRYADTNSMDPLLDKDANGIEIVPESPEDIALGDIIAYDSDKGLIVHRVIEKGEDEKGVWFITKGDNSPRADEKIYFDKIRYKTIGVLW